MGAHVYSVYRADLRSDHLVVMQELCWLLALFHFVLGAQAALSPLPFRRFYRRTTEGRLCAQAFVHDGSTYEDCASAPAPDGTVGKDWCYVDSQVASASDTWGYCSPRVNYPGIRRRVQLLYEAKAYELASTVDNLMALGREASALQARVEKGCADAS